MEPLTPEQIENWRNTLFNIIGPVALVLPVADIEAFREMMQKKADELEGDTITEATK